MFYLLLCSTLSACLSGTKTKGIAYVVVLRIDIQCILRLLISEVCAVIWTVDRLSSRLLILSLVVRL